jgi:hypothetical protein
MAESTHHVGVKVGVEGAEDAAAKMGYIQTAATTFANAVTSKFVGIFSAVAVGEMAFEKLNEAMKKNMSTARQVSSMSAKFHIDPQQVHSLMIAAEKAGANVRMLMMGMKQLGQVAQKSLIDKDKANIFKQIGIDVAELSDVAAKPAAHLADIAKGLMNIKDIGQRTAAGTALMGRGYQQMLPLIEKIGTSESEREKFLENENALTGEQVEQNKAIAMAQKEMEESWNKLVANITPFLTKLYVIVSVIMSMTSLVKGLGTAWKAAMTATVAENVTKIEERRKVIKENAENDATSEGKLFKEWKSKNPNGTLEQFTNQQLVKEEKAGQLGLKAAPVTGRQMGGVLRTIAPMLPGADIALLLASEAATSLGPVDEQEEKRKAAIAKIGEKRAKEMLKKYYADNHQTVSPEEFEANYKRLRAGGGFGGFNKDQLKEAGLEYGRDAEGQEDKYQLVPTKLTDAEEKSLPISSSTGSQVEHLNSMSQRQRDALKTKSQRDAETAEKKLARQEQEEKDEHMRLEVAWRKSNQEELYFDEEAHTIKMGKQPKHTGTGTFLDSQKARVAKEKKEKLADALAKSRRHIATDDTGVEAAEQKVEVASGDVAATQKKVEEYGKAKVDGAKAYADALKVIQDKEAELEKYKEGGEFESGDFEEDKQKLEAEIELKKEGLKQIGEANQSNSDKADQAEIKMNTALNARTAAEKNLIKVKEQAWLKEQAAAQDAHKDAMDYIEEQNQEKYHQMHSEGKTSMAIAKEKFNDELIAYKDSLTQKEALEAEIADRIQERQNAGEENWEETDAETAQKKKAREAADSQRKKTEQTMWAMDKGEAKAVVSDLGKMGGGRAVQFGASNPVDEIRKSNEWLRLIAKNTGAYEVKTGADQKWTASGDGRFSSYSGPK